MSEANNTALDDGCGECPIAAADGGDLRHGRKGTKASAIDSQDFLRITVTKETSSSASVPSGERHIIAKSPAEKHSSDDRTLTHDHTAWSDYVATPRFSIVTLLLVTSAAAAIVIMAVVFLILVLLIEGYIADFLKQYADAAGTRVATTVERHFSDIRQTGLVAATAMSSVNYLANFPNGVTPFARMFGALAVRIGCHIAVSTDASTSLSYSVGPYSAADVHDFPPHDGFVAVQVSNASTPLMQIGYFYESTGLPVNVTHPQILYPSLFNFSARPFGSLFRVQTGWSTPYTSMFTRTAAVGFGGPQGTEMFGVFDLTSDLVSRLGDLKLSLNGKAMVFDRHTGSYIAGNVADDILVNDATTGVPRLRHIYEVYDASVAAFLLEGWSQFLACSGSCQWIFATGDGLTSRSSDAWNSNGAFSIFRDYVLIRVIHVEDAYGLSLTVVVATPASDFASQIRQSVLRGLMIAGIVGIGLLTVVGFGAVVVLAPLRRAAGMLRTVFRKANRDHASTASTTTGELMEESSDIEAMQPSKGLFSLWCRDGVQVRELGSVITAIERFRSELAILRSFLSDSTTGRNQLTTSENRSGREDSFSPSLVDDVNLDATEDNPAELGGKLDLDRRRSTVERTPFLIPSGTWLSLVTFVAMDLEKFHSLRQSLLPSVLEERHSAYIRLVIKSAERHGGSVLTFYGDRVMAHFNAERRCRRHAMAATQMMLDVRSEAAAAGLPRVRLGASTTQAYCGIMGPETMRRFHVVGPCVHQSVALSSEGGSAATSAVCSYRTTQLARTAPGAHAMSHGSRSKADARVLTRDDMQRPEVGARVFFRHHRFAVLPYERDRSSVISCPIRISSIGSEVTVRVVRGVLEDGCVISEVVVDPAEVLSLLQRSNDAFEALSSGDVAQAEAILRDLPLTDEDCWLKAVIS